jgi:RimJ/RimL family protein N-acetyltransferase
MANIAAAWPRDGRTHAVANWDDHDAPRDHSRLMAPRIETPRLVLRPWQDEDVEHWVAMSADPRVMEFFPSVSERFEAEAMAARLRERLEQNAYGWWVVEVKGGPLFAGAISLQDVPFESHFTPALEVGWRLVHDRWGHGYATEGAHAALDYAFGTLGHHEVVAMTAAVNLRSQRVMQRLGMTHDPADDFDHPRLPEGDRLRRHVLYRIAR